MPRDKKALEKSRLLRQKGEELREKHVLALAKATEAIVRNTRLRRQLKGLDKG
jgi:hypothetical protein